ncbi:ash family protein [Klebsiella michiganensis]|uniref:ash family protein n=1 Tax=Klebsiella michiganensis TaxID=1134687 RepID=UPI003D002629
MMSFCNSTHVRGGISLAGLMYTDINVQNLRKPVFKMQEMENCFPRVAGGLNCISTSGSRAAFDFATSTRAGKCSETDYLKDSASASGCVPHRPAKCKLPLRDKKGLMFDYIPVYGYSAPAKSGAGRRNPLNIKATQTPKASFFVSCHRAHRFSGTIRNVSMVALAGQPSGWPVSFVSGIPTPVNVTTPLERRNSGGDSLHTKEAATWLLPLPKNRNLSGLSPLFAAICRQLKPKSITSPHILSARPAALWFGITSAFSLAASVWRCLMRNYFRITGYAVNKRGLTVGIGYDITSSDTRTAKAHAMLQAQRDGLIHIRILRVQEVAA